MNAKVVTGLSLALCDHGSAADREMVEAYVYGAASNWIRPLRQNIEAFDL